MTGIDTINVHTNWQAPKARTMRRIGFTDHVPETWYYSTKVGDATTLNVSIDKETGAIDTLVMNEHFGQPEYYGHMVEPFRSATKWNIEVALARLNDYGLNITLDHAEYGYTEKD